MKLQDYGWSPFFANQLDLTEMESSSAARVLAVHRSAIVVTDGEGERRLTLGSGWYTAEPALRPTVGDWLLLNATRDKALRMLERKSLLKRLAAGPTAEVQLIAANVDTIFIVTSCSQEFNESRMERYLATTSNSGAQAVVVLTKMDLVANADDYVDRLRRVSTDVPVELVNALDPATLIGTRAWCAPGQTVALIGSSGVGKSTLVNSLAGRTIQLTGGIREDDAHGRHTTTSRSLHLLEGGALLLDVPGLRELGLVGAEHGVAELFDDLEAVFDRCRFADCAHQSEPGCAVQAAIESGDLDPRRLRNYQKMLREEARNTSTIAQRHEAAKALGRLHRKIKKTKRRDER